VVVWEYVTSPWPLKAPADKTTRLQKHHYYWLHCADPEDHQHIRAEREGNTIKLEINGRGAGHKGLTIFLNPQMIDVQKDVVVIHHGKEVYRGRPSADLWTVLQTMDARLDRSMVFDRRIEL
jgi:hypothetical protein